MFLALQTEAASFKSVTEHSEALVILHKYGPHWIANDSTQWKPISVKWDTKSTVNDAAIEGNLQELDEKILFLPHTAEDTRNGWN